MYDSLRLTAFGLDGSAGATVRGVPVGRLGAMYISTVAMSSVGPIVLQEVHDPLTSSGYADEVSEMGSFLGVLRADGLRVSLFHAFDFVDYPRTPGGVLAVNANQARPLAAFSPGRKCLYLSDGESDQLRVLDLASGEVRILDLPEITDRVEPRVGARFRREDAPEPTALSHWTRMVVDRDGWIWLAPWQSRRTVDDPWRVVALNPDTGESRMVSLPVFPDEFTDAGGYFSIVRDHDTMMYEVRWFGSAVSR